MRPATHSTDDPPCKVEDIELAEYIWGLRRRIEVQQDFITQYVKDRDEHVNRLNTEIDRLSLDLKLKRG